MAEEDIQKELEYLGNIMELVNNSRIRLEWKNWKEYNKGSKKFKRSELLEKCIAKLLFG